jgi:hypothetical protein
MMETDTDPDIQECIFKALHQRRPQCFEEYAEDHILEAARDQDHIGCGEFVEGKISRKWRKAQDRYYRSIDSRRTSRRWAEGLVKQMLTMTHRQWTYRNSVVHERDAQGRMIEDGIAMEQAIEREFTLGRQGLHQDDWHYIDRGRADVNRLRAPLKQSWLQGLQIARDAEARDERNEMVGMRNGMRHWLIRN